MIFRLVLAVSLMVLAGVPTRAQEGGGEPFLDMAGGLAGFGFYSPEGWGVVRSVIANPTNEDADLLLTFGFREDPSLQFGSKAWVPARSELVVHTLINPSRLPVISERGQAEGEVFLVTSGEEGERILDRQIALLPMRDTPSPLASTKPRTDSLAPSLVRVARVAAGLTPAVYSASPQRMPDQYDAWAGLEVLAISGSLEDFSQAQLDAARAWLRGGGRVWLMLDEVEPNRVAQWLASDWRAAVLGRVHLTGFEMKDDRGEVHTFADDYPVTMTRVLLSDPKADVHYTIDGYPAAWSQRVGEGELLVTTLTEGPWLLDSETPKDALKKRLSGFTSHDLLQRTAGGGGAQPADSFAALDIYAQTQIGYDVLRLGPVAGVLLAFAGLLLVGGLVLMKRGGLEWAAVLGVGLAIVASGLLVGMGRWRQSQTEGVIASISALRPQAGSSAARVESIVSMYRPPGHPADVELMGHGPLPVISGGLEGRGLLRLVKTDRDGWRFENLDLAPGVVRSLRLSGLIASNRTLTAVGRFGPQGLTITLPGEPSVPMSDTLLITRGGVMAPTEAGDATWLAAPRDETTAAAPLRAVMLSQEQIARQQVYQHLLSADGGDEPVLAGWTSLAPAEVAFDGDEIGHRPSTLVLAPLRLQAPAPGTPFVVPSPLLAMSAYRDTELGSSATVYDEARRQFVGGITQGQLVLMRYMLPEALSGAQIDSLVVSYDLTAPQRLVELVVSDGETVQAVATEQAPMGRGEAVIEQAQFPGLLSDGRSILVGLQIPDPPPGQATAPAWTLRDIDLQVHGVMPAE